LQPGTTGKEIVIHNYASLNVNAVIVNNGVNATVLTIAGNGTTMLIGANTYTGITNLINGTLNINSTAALGTGTFAIGNGSSIALNNTSGGAINHWPPTIPLRSRATR